MSYRFKPWLDEHVTKLRDEHWPTNKEAGNKSSQSYRDLSSVQNPRCLFELSKVSGTFLTKAPLVGSWPLGWSELPCVCVCFSWAWAEIEVVNRILFPLLEVL